MKYFAMIDGRQVGPMELAEVVEAGVRPDTYVWCKGMPDWNKAAEVPDICRFFRQRLSGTLPAQSASGTPRQPQQYPDEQAEQEMLIRQLPPMARGLVRKSGIKLRKEDFPQLDPDNAGRHESRWLPVVIYTVCFILLAIGFYLLYH